MNRATAYTTDDPFRRGAGYLYLVGILQLTAGALSLLFSLLGFLQIGAAEAGGLLDPGRVSARFVGGGLQGWATLVAGFVAFQLAYGWIFGLLLIAAGIASIKRRARCFVWLSTIVNLFPAV